MSPGEEKLIEVKDLGKAYPVYRRSWHILAEMATGRRYHDQFWALKNVNFTIRNKQRVGIIGHNGSGKSTLLKILTGNLSPSLGHAKIYGKISAMLSLASTLNPEETGIDNIKFNLLLGGCPPHKIPEATEEIIDFTELGSFIYSPVKTYSSGMNAKLAFALTTAIEPEILVVDEVLSVGDAYFVAKAIKRMKELCDRGKGLLFVSHSNEAVLRLCDTAIWLDGGVVRMMGSAPEVVGAYEKETQEYSDTLVRSGNRLIAETQSSKGISLGKIEATKRIFRIVPTNLNSKTFTDTHFVKGIKVLSGVSSAAVELDSFSSEWGGLYNRDGEDCRLLSARSGRKRGGHVIFDTSAFASSDANIAISFESKSIRDNEVLGVEVFDFKALTWIRLDCTNRNVRRDGWILSHFSGRFEGVSKSEFAIAVENLEKLSRPAVEIVSCHLTRPNAKEKIRTIKEREPFFLHVQVRINTRPPVFDVGINITRSDGYYAFWQSSGLAGENVTDADGDVMLTFQFNENYFSSGDYFVHVYSGNGWEPVHNFPHSEIFDRKLNILKFTVDREFSEVMFGQINCRVPVVSTVNSAIAEQGSSENGVQQEGQF